MSSLDKPPPPPIVIKDGLPALSAEEQAEMEALPDYEIRQKIGKWWDKKGVTCWIPEVEHDFRSKRDRKREWSVELGSIADRFGNIVPCFFIWSKYLRKIIRGAIKFDGALDRQSPRFDVDEPYCTFFHHWDDIQAKFLADKDASEDDRDAFAALTWAYNNGVFEDSDDDVTPRELHDSIRDSIKEGFINFNAIWALYKPGSKILFKDSLGEWQMAMCVACTKAIRDGKNLRYEPPTWEVTLWHMTWNAADECFTRTVGTYRLKRFTGTRRIVTLPLLPLEFYQDQTSQLSPAECQSQLENELRDRGLKWKKFVSEPPRCFFYDGPAATMLYPARGNMIRSINEPPRRIRDDSPSRGPSKTTKLKGRIVVEQNQNLAFADLYDRNSPDMFSMDVSGDDDREEFAAFDNCAKDSEFDPTGLQAMLCPAAISCYYATKKSWHWVSVNKVQDVPWMSDAFNKLVLAKEKKDTLTDILENYVKDKGQGVPDIILGKGEGLIILLHGPPGVGKTLTAESVAEYMRRPLQSISFSALIQSDNFEDHLRETFHQASRHGAVLLLDEADVVLEKRAFEDIRRNSMVSAFLATIEYFDGVVFLTTNRPKTMDPAFESRIHHTIEYEKLNSATRLAIWRQFLNSLEPRIPENIAAIEDNLDIIKNYELNGRQIRNVINISAAIARARTDGVLDFNIVKGVAKKTENFKGAEAHDVDEFGERPETDHGWFQNRSRGRNFV